MEQVKKDPCLPRKMLVALIVPLIFEQLLNVFVVWPTQSWFPASAKPPYPVSAW